MGPMCVTVPNFIKIGQTVADIRRFNSFHNVGRPPSWIFGNSNFLTAWALKRLILHNRAKFRKDLSFPWCDNAICVVFQDDHRRHLVFFKIRNFNGLSHVASQSLSPCQISSKSVKQLRRYDDLTVFKLAAVRHIGFWKFNFFNCQDG